MNGALPFVGSKFGRAEREFAAALLVRACALAGDEWAAQAMPSIGHALKSGAESGGPFEHLKTNPFMPHPDFRDLVAKGFARFVGDPDQGAPVEFTEKGLEAVETFAKKRESKP